MSQQPPRQPPYGPPPGWPPQDQPGSEQSSHFGYSPPDNYPPQYGQPSIPPYPPQLGYGTPPPQYSPSPPAGYPPQYPQQQPPAGWYPLQPQFAYAPPQEQAEFVVPRLRASIPDFVRKTIHPSEQILAAFNASLFDHRRPGEFRHDKFLLTTDRIIYYHTAIIHKGMGEMPYRMITGVQYNRGFRHGKVVVEAANAGLTMDGINNDDAAFAEKIIAGSVAGRKFQVAQR